MRFLTGLLKTRAPSIHRALVRVYLWTLDVGPALREEVRYACCRLSRRPYFGGVMKSALTAHPRRPHMRRLMEMALAATAGQRPFNVLEIGSWAGESSVLWASGIRDSGRAGRVFCVDPWLPFLPREDTGTHLTLRVMDRAAQRDRIFPLFWHNVKASGLTDVIVPLRGRSADTLPMLAPASFDLAYVDGAHAYSTFVDDLRLVAPLVREQGLLCGDDLELQLDEVDAAHAEEFRERDYIVDPKTGHSYHPGICTGVACFFGRRVSCYDGFWVLRKSKGGWHDVPLG